MPFDSIEGYYMRCDPTTRVFLIHKNKTGRRFILDDSDQNSLVIEKSKMEDVSNMINDWIEESNRSKVDEEKKKVRK